MVFSSPIFLFVFFPIMFIIYYLLKKQYRNGWLLFCSLVFYAWSGLKYLIILLFSVIFNFLISKRIEQKNGKFLLLGIIFNIGLLGIYKYLNFFIENIASFLGWININFTINRIDIIMPIGISFFTFQILAYDIDLYWGKVERQQRLDKLLLYVSMFPQLIAGPIVRYIDVEKEIENREISKENVYYGLQRFVIGLAEKVLLADLLGNCLNFIFVENVSSGTLQSWLGMGIYSMQIYLDFAGYSDMAIGMGEMLGFHFSENFINPYLATSIQDFWRRWHISLSSWFRDYLYIPLGGNRGGKWKTYRNLLIIFAVTGLWHGASWNFVIWGLWHGGFAIFERLGGRKFLIKMPNVLQRIYTLLVVGIGWLMFRTDRFYENLNCIKRLFIYKSSGSLTALVSILDIKLIICIIISTIICLGGLNWKRKQRKILFDIGIILLFWCVIMQISASQFSPFLYFRF